MKSSNIFLSKKIDCPYFDSKLLKNNHENSMFGDGKRWKSMFIET